jgi:hypothetical protein
VGIVRVIRIGDSCAVTLLERKVTGLESGLDIVDCALL